MLDWAWQLYDYIPPQARGHGRLLLSFLKCLAPGIPVTILHGRTRLGKRSGAVVTAGSEPWVDYLPDRFFEGSPQREWVGKVPLWALPRTLERLSSSANLVVARVDRLSARLLFNASYLRVPEWVDLWLTVPDDLNSLQRGNHRRDVKNDLRRIRRNGLLYDISHADADLDVFYNDFYVPFVRRRFGKYAYTRNVQPLRYRFHQGGLLWVLHNDRRIAATIFHRQGTVLHSLGIGTIDGSYDVANLGALIATKYYKIKHAHATGCKEINFGGSRPILTDGGLRHKRKWGMRLVEQTESYYEFLVYWKRLDESVLPFLSRSPLILRDRGKLSAVTAIQSEGPATQDEAEKAHRFLWTPGLHRLYLLSASGWQPGTEPPPQTQLIDLTTVEHEDLPALFTSRSLGDIGKGTRA
jgi:hypothetical protein